MSDDIVIKDGYIYGGWRQPVNYSFKLRNIKSLGTSYGMDLSLNIHDDKVAKKIGMRGGTVRGTVHLNLFPPLLIELFGNRWFEKGSLSMYYTFPSKPKEKVRAVIALPPEGAKDVQLEARVEMENGQVVEKGTISVGNPSEPSYLRALELVNSKPEELRVLAEYKAGDPMPSHDVIITEGLMNDVLPTITDNIDYYTGESPWGEPIATPNLIYMALELLFSPSICKGAIPFFGATEVRNLNGPVKIGVPYKATGKFISVGQTSKTEYYWQDSFLEEKDSGKIVADMRHMNRFMKATSPLYRDG